MDKGYEKEPFRTVCIKRSVLTKFKGFSRRQGKSHSMTLLAMVEFFEHNGISPDERMHETIASLKYLIKRRFNAVVAIMRSIEKEQTLPTVSMIQALFEQELESNGEEWDSDFDFIEERLTENKETTEPQGLDTEVTVPKIRYDRLEEQLQVLKDDFAYVLDHISVFHNPLGKDHLQVDLNAGAIEKYRTKLKNR